MNEFGNMDFGALGGSALPNGPLTSAVDSEAPTLNGFFDFLSPQQARAGDKPLLKAGSQGPDVITLQTLLGIAADGQFGPSTQKALQSFQAKRGLSATGQADAQTWAALLGAAKYRTPEERTARQQQTAAKVEQGASTLTSLLSQMGMQTAPGELPQQVVASRAVYEPEGLPTWAKVVGGALLLGAAVYGGHRLYIYMQD